MIQYPQIVCAVDSNNDLAKVRVLVAEFAELQ